MEAQMSKSQVVWVSGYPSTGKTFIGDYLASKGWTHVDGDAGQQQSQGPLRDKWNKLCQVFFDISQNKPVQEQDWLPYYEYLADKIKEALTQNSKVVMTFAHLGYFGEKPWLEKQFPEMQFIHVQVSKDLMMERFFARSAIMMERANLTREKIWASEGLKTAREKHGEEYTPERYRAMIEETLFSYTYVDFAAPENVNCHVVSNDDFKAWQHVNKILGLPYEENIDAEAIKEIQFKRYEKTSL